MEQGKRGHNGIPPVRNIVFMGMGEPLHNVDAVVQAIEKLTDEDWFGISQRSITVSTAGVPRGMIMLAERFPRLRLALSLHSGDPRKRRELVPHAVGDLQRLRETISIVNSIQEGPVWIEIALLDGVNDGLEDAKGVIEFCKGLRVEVNVIPYNDTSHASFEGEVSLRAPVLSRVDEYIRELRRSGLFTTYRKTQGESIQAACGQLISQ
jgi:23S rRNA (adenine2503-C2)-methyltransferase